MVRARSRFVGAFLLLVLLSVTPSGAPVVRTDPGGDGGGPGCDHGPIEVDIWASAPELQTPEIGMVGQAWFKVRLQQPPPNGYVYLTARTEDPSEGKIWSSIYYDVSDTETLIFDTGNWYQWQTIGVVGMSDCIIDGGVHYTFSVVHPSYSTCPIASIPAFTQDDGHPTSPASIVASPSTGMTTERGEIASFNLKLTGDPSCPPKANVTLTATSGDVSEGQVKGPSNPGFGTAGTVVFTPSNYGQWQTLQVRGVSDIVQDGNVSYAVALGSSSSDGYYSGRTGSLAMVNNDAYRIALEATPATGLTTSKMGATASSQVRLVCEYAPCPAANVVVNVATDTPAQGLVKAPADPTFRTSTSLTFTPANYGTPQTVAIRGVDDGYQRGDTPYAVNLSATSADSNYSGRTAAVSVVNLDRTDYNACTPWVPLVFDNLNPVRSAMMTSLGGLPSFEYDGDPGDEHFESIARAKHGPYLYITGKDHNRSDLLVNKLPAKAGMNGRWTTNDIQPGDGIVNYASSQIDVDFDHAGGMSTFGDFLSVPLEGGHCGGTDNCTSKVVFFDVSNPQSPSRVGGEIFRPSYNHAGSTAVTKLRDGRYLLAVQSDCPARVDFYVSDGLPITQSPTWTNVGYWDTTASGYPSCDTCFGHPATLQNMTFVRECVSEFTRDPDVPSNWGDLYLIATHNSGGGGPLPWELGGCNTGEGTNYAVLWRLNIDPPPAATNWTPYVSLVSSRVFNCYAGYGMCNFAAGAGVYVSPFSKELIMYGVDYYQQYDPSVGRIIKMGEF